MANGKKTRGGKNTCKDLKGVVVLVVALAEVFVRFTYNIPDSV